MVNDALDIVAWVLRLLPMIVAFYIPALIGTAIWREGGPGYKVQSGLWFAVGFGFIGFLYVVFTSATALEILSTLAFSVLQIMAALVLARLTVYRLAD